MAEERLILDLVTRICGELPYRTDDKPRHPISKELLERESEALINLAGSSQRLLPVIASGLSEQMSVLQKPTTLNDDAQFRHARSERFLIDLLRKCLAAQWNQIRQKYKTAAPSADEAENIRIKSQAEQDLPPPLEENLANNLINQVTNVFFRKGLSEEFRKKAGLLLLQLSATNYDQVFMKLASGLEEEDEEDSSLQAVEYLNLTMKRLSELVTKLLKIAQNMKKGGSLTLMAKVLRQAIWNWIDNYPMEFVTLSQSGAKMPGAKDSPAAIMLRACSSELFDVFDAQATKTKTKTEYWPIQTMLMILCPDIMLNIYTTSKDANKDPKGETKALFLENLKKALKAPKLADVAAVCFVDLSKASTYVSKTDMSGLRHTIPAIEQELKDRVFNPKDLFKAPDGSVDVKIMTDCLLAFFRLNPRKVIGGLQKDFLGPGLPQVFRLVLVKCLLNIAKDTMPLPWNPRLSDVYPNLSGALRTFFLELQQQARTFESMARNPDKKTKAAVEKLNFQEEVLTKLIALFNADPALCLFPIRQNAAHDIEDIRALLNGLAECCSFLTLPALAEQAGQALLQLHHPKWIERWCPKDIHAGFWEISSAVNATLANVLVAQKDLKVKEIQKLVGLLEEILVRRTEFLRKQKEIRPEFSVASSAESRSNASTKLEVALLVHLCSAEPELVSSCVKCFGHLCDEIEIVTSDVNTNTIAANYRVYRKLSTRVMTTGRAAQQKAIRNVLRRIDNQTPGNLTAWEDVYSRWKEYTPSVRAAVEAEAMAVPLAPGQVHASPAAPKKTRQPIVVPAHLADKPSADAIAEWQHFTGFLLALSGVCMKSGKGGKGTANLEQYFTELMELTGDPIVNIREPVKMLIGQALAPSAYSIGFRHLHDVIKTAFGSAGQVQVRAQATLFVDQVIHILKLVLEAPLETPDELSQLTDFEALVLDLLKYVSQLLPSLATLVIKKKACELMELAMDKKSAIPFRAEFKWRNQVTEIIIEWMSDFANVTKEGAAGRAPSAALPGPQSAETLKDEKEMPKVQRDLDLQCVKAMHLLLSGLPLGEASKPEEKSSRFTKYFNFFTNLLTRCKKDAEAAKELPDYAIQALSAVLSANIDCGLEHFVTMGYHEDHDTRSAFLKVLSNILNQGAEFDAVNEDSEDKYENLMALVMDQDLKLILALCDATPITEADDVAQLLVRVFEAQGQAMHVIKELIRQEVNKTESANTLFRRNSMATKVQAAYAKLIGNQYLKETFALLLNDLLAQTLSFELDPQKLATQEDVNANLENLRKTCTTYLKVIKDHVTSCPLPFRDICHFLREVVKAKYPEHALTAVGGFIFLRFLCPAIVSPDGFNIIPALPNPQLRRGLILVTKVLQNLANGVVQFTKEPWMAGMNPFVEQNLSVVAQMLEEFAELPATAPPAPVIPYNEEQKEEDFARLHYYLSLYSEKITKLLAAGDQQQTSSKAGSTIAGRGLHTRFNTIMAVLGPPPAEPERRLQKNPALTTSATKSANAEFDSFMQSMRDKSTEIIKDQGIFYQAGLTRTKEPVFYFVVKSNLHAPEVDMDLLLLHVLRSLQPFWSKPFVVVVDLTLFSMENRQPPQLIARFMRTFPILPADNLKQVIFIGPNHPFKKYVKGRISKMFTHLAKKVVFVPSASGLGQYVNEPEQSLPSGTLAVDSEVKAIFDSVQQVSNRGVKNVILRVATTSLQVISAKHYQMMGASSSLTDLYHISRIEDISLGIDGNIVVKYDWGGPKYMAFRSPGSGEQIVQALKASKARWNLAKEADKKNRSFQPSDVPGTLLNMALLNLSQQRATLRAAAYSLLDALCSNFKFSVRLELLDTTGLCIPRNSTHFVTRISSKLAETEQQLTLEFLKESLLSFTKASLAGKQLCLEYLNPWIPNLETFVQPSPAPEMAERLMKTREIISFLLELTLRENQLEPAVHTNVWRTIGYLPVLMDISLELIIAKLVEDGLGSAAMEALGEVVVTLAAQSTQAVAGRLVSRLLKLATSASVKENLEEYECWNEIMVLSRLVLLLSFENLLFVEIYLPELFHLVILLFSSGSYLMRSITHGLVINIVHSLYTSVATADDKLQSLRFLLGELSQLRFRLLFGIASTAVTAFHAPNPKEKKPERMAINTVDNVANALLMVLNYCSPVNNAVGTAWHSRWLTLSTIAAFGGNPAIAPRGFVAMGVLSIRDARGESHVTDDLVREVLLRLKEALLANVKDIGNDLPVSHILCLSRLFEFMPQTSKYFMPLFWLATTLVQVGDIRLYTASLQLLEVILKTLDYTECFKDLELSQFVMSVREGAMDNLLTKLDMITGISFKNSFSFAIAAHLLKGLRHPQTKTSTSRVISSFVDISARKAVGPNILGYIAALLPTKGDEMSNLRQLFPSEGNQDVAPTHYFFSELMLLDTNNAVLLFTFLVTLLQNSDLEHEQAFIYESLREGVHRMPDALHVTYEMLIPKMSSAIATSQNKAIVDSVLAIMNTMFTYLTDSSTKKLTRAYLTTLGFGGLPDYESFGSVVLVRDRESVVKTAAALVDLLVESK